jgi:hypothetical protein
MNTDFRDAWRGSEMLGKSIFIRVNPWFKKIFNCMVGQGYFVV